MALCPGARDGPLGGRGRDALRDPDRRTGATRPRGVCLARPDRVWRRLVRVVPAPPGGAPRQRLVRGEAAPSVATGGTAPGSPRGTGITGRLGPGRRSPAPLARRSQWPRAQDPHWARTCPRTCRPTGLATATLPRP